MDKSLFSFIWRYSKRDQLALLVLTVLSFPFLYASLELPKRIINDAVGSVTSNVTVLGWTLSQEGYLAVLCVLFLAAVVTGGLMKMLINTYKGLVSERMLRRLRYRLLSRLMRFPAPYFHTTSQGELVSMVTAEAEPLGGLMGDAVAQPVFQAGQMLTIVTFLFLQSVWFGLASIALIPLQAWLIPRIQRQINLMNKDRIVEVRRLSSEIGETAAGIADLRANGGWRYRGALLSDRLGRIFAIRLRIYRKKYFMKFLNNFITQLTPFFFYMVGGYLAIKGQISVGALVAGLAAYKDIAGPWKELLTYYNQVQDMSLRWKIVIERFAPRGMIDESLFDGVPDQIPHLKGTLEMRGVTVRDHDGQIVLEDLSLDIPAGARVAVRGGTAAECGALAAVLTREVVPVRGSVHIAGRDIATLHAAVIAARIGYAHSRPYLFDGPLARNLLMPFGLHPRLHGELTAEQRREIEEARRAGGSPDLLEADWVDPAIGGYADADDLGAWWFRLISAIGQDDAIFRRGLQMSIDPDRHPDLSATIVGLRDAVWARLRELGLDDAVRRFDPDRLNPAVPLAWSLLYAVPRRAIPVEDVTRQAMFADLVETDGLGDEALAVGQSIVTTLHRTFGRDGTDHPLFQRLGLDKDMYLRLLGIVFQRRVRGDAALSDADRRLLMTVPFTLSAEQIGQGFSEALQAKILAARRTHGRALLDRTGDLFVPIDPGAYLPRLSVLENALFGRISLDAGARAADVEEAVAELLTAEGLRWRIARLIFDLDTGIGGANLSNALHERAAFSRAVIKRPDILILDRVLASHDPKSRAAARTNLRDLLPGTTMIFMERTFRHPEEYDLVIDLRDGRIDGTAAPPADDPGDEDFQHKLRLIAGSRVFGPLAARHQRLLAYSAHWFEAEAGQTIFRTGQPADAVYLCVAGAARLQGPGAAPEDTPITRVGPGDIVGELAILRNEARRVDLVAVEPSRFLRIGAREFRDVIEADTGVAMTLLETLAGQLSMAVGILDGAGADGERTPSPKTVQDDATGDTA